MATQTTEATTVVAAEATILALPNAVDAKGVRVKPEKKPAGENGEPIWARMAGFPAWPGRRCLPFEEEKMKFVQSATQRQVAVVFFGSSPSNGIVQDVCVSAFCPESISEKYLPKKFKSDKDYRASVVEATRLAMWNGTTFPSEFMETLAGCEFPLTLSANEICVTCGGSSYSGQMMQCHNCNVMQRHWHCFPLMNEGAWLCDSCCQKGGVPAGTVVPFEDEGEVAPKTPRAEKAAAGQHALTAGTKERSSSKQNRSSASTAAAVGASRVEGGVDRGGSGGGGGDRNSKATAPPALRTGSSNGSAHSTSAKQRTASLIKKIYTALDNGTLPSAHIGHNSSDAGGIWEDQQQWQQEQGELGNEEGTDDHCFICGLGGHLLLCDYPQCVRAYHQMCILRVCPSALDAILTKHNSSRDATYGLSTQAAQEEPWFCPSHLCAGCHSLQLTGRELELAEIPRTLYGAQQRSLTATAALSAAATAQLSGTATTTAADGDGTAGSGDSGGGGSGDNGDSGSGGVITRRSIGGNHNSCSSARRITHIGAGGIVQKELRSCERCPFAVCYECERIVAAAAGESKLLQCKRHTEILECVNCASATTSPRIKLARLLEQAWVKMVNSRLAVPFLRPLLPLLSNTADVGQMSVDGIEQSGSGSGCGGGDGGGEAYGLRIAVDPDVPASSQPTSSCTDLLRDAQSPRLSSKSSSTGNPRITSSASANSLATSDPPPLPVPTIVETAAQLRRGAKKGSLASPNAFTSASTPGKATTAGKGNKRKVPAEDTDAPPAATVAVQIAETTAANSTVAGSDAAPAAADVTTASSPRKRGRPTKVTPATLTASAAVAQETVTASDASSVIVMDVPSEPTVTDPPVAVSGPHKVPEKTEGESGDDLLGVLDKIRALRYASCAEYSSNLQRLRQIIVHKLGSREGDEARRESLLMAWDTIVEAGAAHLHSKNADLATIEASIRATDVLGPAPASASAPAAVSPPTAVTAASALSQLSTLASGKYRKETLLDPKKPAPASAPAPAPAPAQVRPTLPALMQSLWRVECTYGVPALKVATVCTQASSGANGTSSATAGDAGDKPEVSIPARSLAGWAAYVEAGAMPVEHRGPEDPFSIQGVIGQWQRQYVQNQRARDVAAAILGLGSTAQCYEPGLVEQEESYRAAQLMNSLCHSAQREGVSLLEGAAGLTESSTRFKGYFAPEWNAREAGVASNVPDFLCPDESLVILDRLREVTQSALQLEERLRREYVAKQRRLFETDTEVVTMGQASIITELKLANDDLRWRLQQKQSVVNAQDMIIADLRRQLEQYRQGQQPVPADAKADQVGNNDAIGTTCSRQGSGGSDGAVCGSGDSGNNSKMTG